MNQNSNLQNPRIIVIQKLYGYYLNKDTKIIFPKHRYKKFIKDIVNGTIERMDLIEDVINKNLKNDINNNKTELILKLIIMAAIFEFMFMHKTPKKVVISEYIKVSDSFVDKPKKDFLNAILDKISMIREINE